MPWLKPLCWQIYKNMDHADVRAVLPRRTTLASDRGVLCVAHATHKLKAMFFVLVQVRCVAPAWAT